MIAGISAIQLASILFWFAIKRFSLILLIHLSNSRIGNLRDKLNRNNITEVSFMIVNELEALSQTMYWKLKKKAPTGVPVYQQSSLQKDVWEILDGDKDDFLIYDR